MTISNLKKSQGTASLARENPKIQSAKSDNVAKRGVWGGEPQSQGTASPRREVKI